MGPPTGPPTGRRSLCPVMRDATALGATTAGRRPRLLFIAQLPPPVHGAAVMNRLASRSTRLNERFHIAVLPLRFATDIADIDRFRLGKLVVLLATVLRMLGMLAAFRPRVLYLTLSPTGKPFLRDVLFAAAARAFGVVRVYHLHGKGIAAARRSTPWLDRLYQWVFSGAKVIVLSHLLRADVEGLVESPDIAVVNNGIPDPVALAPPPSRRNGGDVRILFLSNMVPEKGFLVLIEALSLLRDRNVSVRADFAGAWMSPDAATAFAAEVRRRGLADRVVHHGPAYGDDKAALFRASDIFALPTFYRFECFPGVLLEAMAYGLPVVTTDEGAIPDIVADGTNGFIVPRRDARALADRLERLVLDPALRRSMGAEGRRVFLDRFQLHHFENALCDALERFADTPAPPRRD